MGKEARRDNNYGRVVSLTGAIQNSRHFGFMASQGEPCDAPPSSIDSLLVPIYRIIAKNVKFIDFENIDRYHKRANQNALNIIVNEHIVKAYRGLVIDCFKEYLNYETYENLTYEYLRNNKYLLTPPLEVVDSINSRIAKIKNDVLLKESQRLFKYYIKSFEKEFKCVLISKTVNKDKVDNSLILLDTRYSNSYRNKVRKRMKYLCFKFGNYKAVLLTLTIDPKIYNNDKLRMWLDIKNQYHRFITALKYHFNKSGRVFPSYICSIESQRNGNPHLHIVFLGASRLIDWKKIKDLWHQGFIFINRTSFNQKIRFPINYITKYITKTYCVTSDKNLLSQSLSWIFNIRSYSCSRGLVFPLKPKSSGEWRANSLIIVNKTFDLDFIEKNIDIINYFSDPLNPLFKDHWI
jgi:hypothetical protein